MNSKKIKQFLDTSFPPYNDYEIVQNCDDKVIAILSYGRNDRIRVTIGYSNDGYSNCKLLQTDFI